jgi:hypothetical protein
MDRGKWSSEPPTPETSALTFPNCSMSDGYDRNRAAQRNAIDLDFSFDVYYHSHVSDPRCMVRREAHRACKTS